MARKESAKPDEARGLKLGLRPEATVFESNLFLSESDFTERRRLVYAALTIVLVAASVLLHRFEYQGDEYLHTLLESAATILALVIGALGLVRFYSSRLGTYLYLGTGFLGTGLLDAYHAVVTSPFVASVSDPDLPDLTAWTWIASRVFLSLFLFVSWVAWYQDDERTRGKRTSRPAGDRSVYITAGFLTVVIIVFFARVPLAGAYQPTLWISRPGELLPGLFFGMALAGYLWKGAWKRDAFEHWLVVALLLSVATHLGFLAFSTQQHDLPVVAAHVLKILSYLAVLTGVMASVYVSFRRESEASATILEANQALAHEVAVRREAKRVLQESEERLQDFLDHATDLIQSTDPMGRVLYVNEAWQRTLGYDDEDLGELDILTLVHPDSRDTFRQVMRRVFQGESVSDFELMLVARDGRTVVCSGSSNCRFEDGQPVATRSIFRDVTEVRRAEEELARSQANVRALFESTGDAIWSVDREYRLLTFNTAYALTVEAITGRVPSVGDSIERVVPPDDVAWFEGCFDRALAGTRFSAVRQEDVAGQVQVYELFFNPIEAELGADGVVVFSKDITQRRRVEEALKRAKQEAEEANRTKSQFMANMSHELRTPLNSVIGFANILLKNSKAKLEDRERSFLERILANGKHLLSLINEILDLSKIEAGRMELDLQATDLGELIRDTVGQMEGQVAGKPVALRVEIDGNPSPFLSDPGKLKQVLINLVGNALRFTEEGEVIVRVETGPEGMVPRRILVRDTGIGIPEDRLAAVFEAFQQADGGTTRKFGGTGLGLTISRSLCALMGYQISVDSTVGEGSTFTIHLAPSQREEASGEGRMRELERPGRGQRTPAREDLNRELNGKTVLVVDDERDSRTLLTHYLEDLGCRVVTATDGIEGVGVARKEHPDLITVDLMMPRMSGWEMLRALRDDPTLRDIPAVVVSVVPEEGTGPFLGAVDLLSKPVNRDELAQVVRRNVSRQARRVLVVDDNPDTRLILRRYLRDAGLVVHTVEHGDAALELLRKTPVDLILLDLVMPVMDGFRTLERLRQGDLGRKVPVVVLTAKNLSEEEERTLADRSSGIILKGEDVEARLKEVLQIHFGAPDRG